MFNIGKILKIDILMDVTTQTVKNGGQRRSCVELVPKLVWNLSIMFGHVVFFLCIFSTIFLPPPLKWNFTSD